ncbi:hypothetical protein BDW22DRAFT_178335 [Trametopsis cervina]|nr:hypothetical protein BDW22DRAFT_178335 [Trametopsis cervina]
MHTRDVLSTSEEDFPRDQLYIDNFCHLAGLTVLYYDYLITFGEEYRHIWRNPRSGASILFLVNRYFAFLVSSAGTFQNIIPQKCSRYSFWRQLGVMATQVIVAAIQFLRIYALYGRNRRIATAVISVALTLIGVAAWAVTGQTSGISIAEGCQFSSSKETAIHIAVAWEALFTFDSLIFILIAAKTYKERNSHGFTGRANLVSLIVRDGAMYFGVMVLAQGANVITYYVCPPVLRGTLSTLSSDISVTMMSRLMLNLHRTAAQNTDIFATTLGGTSAGSTLDSSMEFTTGPGTTTLDSEDGSAGGGGGRTRLSRRIWGFVPVELATFKTVSSGSTPLDHRESVGVV